MPIFQGRLRTKKWVVGSSTHGCWLGSYEFRLQKLFGNIIRPGSVVYDIGAHVGFYTLLASEIVGNRGTVLAFEPVTKNLRYIYEHLRLNNVVNACVIEAAVSDDCRSTTFATGPNSYMGQLSSDGEIEVKTVSLDKLRQSNEFPQPAYLKIDIEGAEYRALVGAKDVLSECRPVVFLSIHSPGLLYQCLQYLDSLEYKIFGTGDNGSAFEEELLAVPDSLVSTLQPNIPPNYYKLVRNYGK